MEYFNTAGSADKNSGGKEYTTLGRKCGGFGELRACATLKSPTQRDEIHKNIGKDKGHPGSRRDGKVFRGMQALGVGAGAERDRPAGEGFQRADSVVVTGERGSGPPRAGRGHRRRGGGRRGRICGGVVPPRNLPGPSPHNAGSAA